MVLGETVAGDPAFMFSFEPEVVWQVWRSLEARIKLTTPQMINAIAVLVNRFSPVIPDYRTVMQFSRLMLSHLPQPSELEGKRAAYPDGQVFQEAGKSLISIQSAASSQGMESKRQSVWQREVRHSAQSKSASASQGNRASEKTTSTETTSTETTSDTELLQAIAHEVRTPLTTIRTLTRLLLRRKDLNPDVIKRLEIIDRECTEQIDRFTLIFRAVELETTQPKNALAALAPISLDQVLQQTIPRWQQQANQYNHTLDVILPQKLPLVITDPTMLDQVLTGLIDRITHSLPPGSHIQVRVSLAGHQLKLQLESQPQNPSSDSTGTSKSKFDFTPALKSIGQLLMFQPETGNLSLNMTVTKNLFQALGGKLIVRQRPQQGEVLTIFLPLDTKKDDL
ncbi:MAG: HAMP domain-containing histidine kinase [Cyanobacteria bacterium CRU_2_1]|nr:HAMP domain-containing histidine kinase [Cyanobacteria bacterium RU_5_0]NJR58542.1 HAMP domain-containing histidine kinase [Cyanobacteria bacterium CRU_2_1]